MLKKDLISALRSIRRNLLVSTVNVLGLSVGLASCLIVYLIVKHEVEFDRFQPDRKRIFRIYSTFSDDNRSPTSGVPTAFEGYIKNQFTGVEKVVNFHTVTTTVSVKDGDDHKNFGYNDKIVVAPPEYFELFNHYRWIASNPRLALTPGSSVVLTESQAKKYFGDLEISALLGKELYYFDSLRVTVSGIVADVKENTDLNFTDFISLSTGESSWLRLPTALNSWRNVSSSSQLFVKISPETSIRTIESQLAVLARKHREHNDGSAFQLLPRLQRLSELHFSTEVGIFDHSNPAVEMKTLLILLGVAIFLFGTAAVNFINLETAQSHRYRREVGLRKILGSSQRRLFLRFLLQTILVCTAAGVVSLVFAKLYFSYVSFFVPQSFQFTVFDVNVLVFLISGGIMLAIIAGLYPAWSLASYKPVVALKGSGYADLSIRKSIGIRKALTIFQLSFSQVLTVSTGVMILQINFMLDKDLGFTSNAVLQLQVPAEQRDRAGKFKNDLLQIPGINAVALSGNPPLSTGYSTMVFSFSDGKEILKLEAHSKQGDTSYLSVYGISILAGRNVIADDSVRELLVNEAFLKEMGDTEPSEAIGMRLDNRTIVGVIKDFHGQPLWDEIKPTVFYYKPGRNVAVKLETVNGHLEKLNNTLNKIQLAYTNTFEGSEFEYYFLDDQLKVMYANEERLSKVAQTCTVIAVLITCLGLFGYFSFVVIQRTKEIGIRKVFGASTSNVLMILCRDFLETVFIAFLISAPISFYVTDLWLEKFSYKPDMAGWIFLASGLVSIFISLITIASRAFFAANANPVDSLREQS